MKDGADLPNVNIGDLYIDPIRREITTGTYGRGAWRASLPDPCPKPDILQQPEPQSACFGGSATFTVVAESEDPLDYQWRKNGLEILGATEPWYIVDPVTNGGDVYDVVVTNACGDTVSDAVLLTLIEEPVIVDQPQDVDGCPGDVLWVFVIASPSPNFQWYRNGELIPGANEFFLEINPAYPCYSGEFTVEVSNQCGSILSEPAAVTVEGCGFGDSEPDADVDFADFGRFQACFTGDGAGPPPVGCDLFDFDFDQDVDRIDWCSLELITTGPSVP